MSGTGINKTFDNTNTGTSHHFDFNVKCCLALNISNIYIETKLTHSCNDGLYC